MKNCLFLCCRLSFIKELGEGRGGQQLVLSSIGLKHLYKILFLISSRLFLPLPLLSNGHFTVINHPWEVHPPSDLISLLVIRLLRIFLVLREAKWYQVDKETCTGRRPCIIPSNIIDRIYINSSGRGITHEWIRIPLVMSWSKLSCLWLTLLALCHHPSNHFHHAT